MQVKIFNPRTWLIHLLYAGEELQPREHDLSIYFMQVKNINPENKTCPSILCKWRTSTRRTRLIISILCRWRSSTREQIIYIYFMQVKNFNPEDKTPLMNPVTTFEEAYSDYPDIMETIRNHFSFINFQSKPSKNEHIYILLKLWFTFFFKLCL